MPRPTRFLSIWLPIMLLPLLVAAGLLWGSVWIPPHDVWTALSGHAGTDSPAHIIIFSLRLPTVVTAVLVGSALSASGLMMQTIFNNPLADPSILGVNAGAGLGAAVALLLMGGTLGSTFAGGGGMVAVSAAAFAGAALVMLLLTGCAALLRNHLMLLVAGVMISYAVGSAVTLLSYFASADGLRSYVAWGMGSLGGVGPDRLPLFAALMVPGLCAVALCGKPLNALLLGDDYAGNLGYRLRPLRLGLLLLSGGLCALSTALCGPIAFLGLAVPHVARLTLHTADHRRLLPATMLWGADITLLCHLLTLLGGNSLLPLNAITALIGAPIAWLVLRGRG